MIATEKTSITIATTVQAPVEKVWRLFTGPEHIINWNSATDEWHSPKAENDLREGGRFNFRMEARDGSAGFDFTGEYTRVVPNQEINYVIDDGRKVVITFTQQENATHISESFEAEGTNSDEMQRAGWQAILDNFKRYVETGGKMEKLRYEIAINAPVEKVYNTMLDEQTYREWTSEFSPTSFYRGSWEKGAKIHFVGVNNEGKEEGMVARIKENIPNQFVSIEHLGLLNGEQEITSGPAVEGWAGALENYHFREENGKAVLSIEVDANQQFKSYFEETWPRALNKLKEICER